MIDDLAANQAFIDKLIAQEAFITKLSGDVAFLKKLVVKKLHIDTIEGNEHNDFEAWFDEKNGLKINNRGEDIFKVDTTGNVFVKNAQFNEAILNNSIIKGKIIPSKELLNTWYWYIMRETTQNEWFQVFEQRIDIGGRMSCFGGRVFYNQNREEWQTAITVYIE